MEGPAHPRTTGFQQLVKFLQPRPPKEIACCLTKELRRRNSAISSIWATLHGAQNIMRANLLKIKASKVLISYLTKFKTLKWINLFKWKKMKMPALDIFIEIVRNP
jgi:hypothetical protein